MTSLFLLKVLEGHGIEIPTKYTGTVDDTSLTLTGKFEGVSYGGDFSLEVKK